MPAIETPHSLVVQAKLLEILVTAPASEPISNVLKLPPRQVCAAHCSKYAFYATQYSDEVSTAHSNVYSHNDFAFFFSLVCSK